MKGATASTAIALSFTNINGHDLGPILLHSPLIVFGVYDLITFIRHLFILFVRQASIHRVWVDVIYFRICVIVNRNRRYKVLNTLRSSYESA